MDREKYKRIYELDKAEKTLEKHGLMDTKLKEKIKKKKDK